MSEHTLPLLPPGDELGDEPADRRRLLLGLGGLAVVAVAAGALLLSGGGEDDIALGPPPGAPVVPVAAATPTPSPTPTAAPATTAVTAARNPFAALQLTTGGAPAAAPVGGGADAGELPAGPALPSTDPGSLPPPAGGGLVDGVPIDDGLGGPPPGEVVDPPPAGPVPEVPTPEEPTPPPTPVGHTLVLAGVGGTTDARTATFTVDGADEVVAVGAAFGPGEVLLLLSLQEGPESGQWTAVLQSGSDEPFDVVTGALVALP